METLLTRFEEHKIGAPILDAGQAVENDGSQVPNGTAVPLWQPSIGLDRLRTHFQKVRSCFKTLRLYRSTAQFEGWREGHCSCHQSKVKWRPLT